jgi:hypothetical protein
MPTAAGDDPTRPAEAETSAATTRAEVETPAEFVPRAARAGR